ncbi:hypothetical protein [uncultured Campylobacter sp.]|uniref:LVIVD repeat-containing protein n=1 Tax=uncultured Campylobacter sp. TaxID=218934 RepID=UPI00260BDEA2|nr:hypothetical protein [uncultured Campylobacter sp.]
MIDPNAKRKRQFTICFAILMVILPLAFLCMKYIDKEPDDLKQSSTIDQSAMQKKETSKENFQIPQNSDKFIGKNDATIEKDIANNSVQIPPIDKASENSEQSPAIDQHAIPKKEASAGKAEIPQNSGKFSSKKSNKFTSKKDVTIYKKDIINNSVQIPFEVRDMMVSQSKKRLYTLGHDRDGISVIDISNLDHIELLGLFYFPEARYNVENIQAAESNDGESLYIASPNLGILRLDVRDPKNIKITTKFQAKGFSKIKLSENNQLAYVKAKNGMVILDISSDNIKMLGEFIGMETFNPIEKGDIAVYSDKYVFMSDFAGLHVLDVSDPKNIKEVYKRDNFGVIINLQISADKKYLYANELHTLNVYSIKNIDDIEHLNNYTVSNRIYTFDIGGDDEIIYLSRSKDGSDDTTLPSIDVLDISGGFEPTCLKSYYMPEADDVNSAIPLDERRMIISLVSDFKGFISVIKNNDDTNTLTEEPIKNEIGSKELEDSSKNIDKSKPVWDLPFSQNGFSSINMAVSTDDGYILAGEYESGRSPDLFMKVDKSGREIWRKIIDKSFIGRGNLIAAQMQSYYVLGNEEAAYIVDKATYKISNTLPRALKQIAPTDNDEFVACDYGNNIFRMDKNAKIIWEKPIDVSHLPDTFYNSYIYDRTSPDKQPEVKKIKEPKDGLIKILKTSDGNFILVVEELGILKFNPDGNLIFETKIDMNGYFLKDMIESDDGSILMLFETSNTADIIKLNGRGELIKKSTVYESKDSFYLASIAKYKEDKYLIGLKLSKDDRLLLLEIDGENNVTDQKYIDNLGKYVTFHNLLNIPDRGVLVAGRRTYTKIRPPEYIGGELVKLSDYHIEEAYMFIVNFHQKLSEQNFSAEDRE